MRSTNKKVRFGVLKAGILFGPEITKLILDVADGRFNILEIGPVEERLLPFLWKPNLEHHYFELVGDA